MWVNPNPMLTGPRQPQTAGQAEHPARAQGVPPAAGLCCWLLGSCGASGSYSCGCLITTDCSSSQLKDRKVLSLLLAIRCC
jgi:hypothetical protein